MPSDNPVPSNIGQAVCSCEDTCNCFCEEPVGCSECRLGASSSSVSYGAGETLLKETDISPGIFGLPWGHRREYTNRLEADYNFGIGWNWLVVEWPYLEEYEDGSILVARGARNQIRFDPKGTQFVPRFGGASELIREGNAFILAAPDGTTWFFDVDPG